MLPRIDGSSEYSSVACYRTAERSTRKYRGTVSLPPNFTRTANNCNVGKVAIDMLPEDVLLEIFTFYMCGAVNDDEWEALVHVCRRWRSIVFSAPRRLNLKLVCTSGTPASKMLDTWPALPIVVRVRGGFDEIRENVRAALEKHDRICKVHVDYATYDYLKELVEAMQVTFPTLTDLHVRAFLNRYSHNDTVSFPESVLGGSAPNLRSLSLVNIAFPGLPNFLSSSPGLVSLSLSEIPQSGYIPSDTMIDCLSSLTRLEYLQIDFPFSELHSAGASRRQPPPTRSVFPVLNQLLLTGTTEYLDQFLPHIEAPLLHHVHIRFANVGQPIFDISRILRWVGLTGAFEAFDQAYMYFRNFYFHVALSSRKEATDGKVLTLSLEWDGSSWKLPELTLDSCDHFSEPFDLCAFDPGFLPAWRNSIGNAPWSHLVRFFAVMKSMYLARGVAVLVVPALQDLTGPGVTEVLPVLRNIFVERLDALGPVQEALGQFVAARQLLSGHYIDVQCWVEGQNSTDQDVGDGS